MEFIYVKCVVLRSALGGSYTDYKNMRSTNNIQFPITSQKRQPYSWVNFHSLTFLTYEGWNFNSGNYLFTTDTI